MKINEFSLNSEMLHAAINFSTSDTDVICALCTDIGTKHSKYRQNAHLECN